MIGHDAYAMILSQYGTLLVALVGEKEMPLTPGDPSKRAALSAMLVACISRHDGTRLPQGDNRLLSESFCRRVLSESLRFALRRV